MLIVRRIGPDAGRYYGADRADHGHEADRADRAGRWWGRGSAALGLDGAVGAEALRRLLQGRDPRSGAPLVPPRADRRAGWDLVFAAPKSVSLLAAGAGTAPEAVGDAHAAAVGDTLAWLQDHACFARRAAGVVAGDGITVARFAHRTSSAGDPHLHDHALVANVVCAAGTWSALDSSALWLQRRAVAAAYHLGLRHHLLARGLRFEWSLAPDGTFDAVAVPRAAVTIASTRGRQVQEALARRPDTASAGAADQARTAARATPARPAAWPSPAGALAEAHRGAARAADRFRRDGPANPAPETVAAAVLGRLASTRSSYGPADAMAALAATHPDGAAAGDAHRFAVGLCAASIPCADGRFTSPAAARADQRLAATMDAQRDRGVGRVAPGVAAEVLAARPELRPGSRADLHRLVTGGRGVEVLRGRPAGPGEAWVHQAALLDAAAEAWERGGHRVAVLAPTATARQRWQALTGLGPPSRDQPPTVLVVDRADRRPTGELQALVDTAGAEGTKVVLVEGGTLPARQRALSEGLEQGAVVLGRLAPWHPDETRASGGRSAALWRDLIDRWAASPAPPLLVALGPAEVEEANHRCRQRRRGRHGPDEVVLAGRRYAEGDRVLTLNARSGRAAGSTGTVTALDRSGPALWVSWDSGDRSRVGARQARAVGVGYATTPRLARYLDRPLLVLGRAADVGRLRDRVVDEVHLGRAPAPSRSLDGHRPPAPGLGR